MQCNQGIYQMPCYLLIAHNCGCCKHLLKYSVEVKRLTISSWKLISEPSCALVRLWCWWPSNWNLNHLCTSVEFIFSQWKADSMYHSFAERKHPDCTKYFVHNKDCSFTCDCIFTSSFRTHPCFSTSWCSKFYRYGMYSAPLVGEIRFFIWNIDVIYELDLFWEIICFRHALFPSWRI